MRLFDREILIRSGQTLLFALTVYLFWSQCYPSHLHFHEQFQLFQYTWHYALEVASLPGGVMHWVSRLLIQFFYYAPVGAAIMALLLMAVQLLTASLLRDRALYPLSFVPALAVWLCLLDANAMPVLALDLCAALAATAVGVRIVPECWRWGYSLLVAPLLFLIAGGIGLLFLPLMALHELFTALRSGAGMRGLWVALTAILLYFLIPLFGTYLYNYPYEQLLKGVGTCRYPLQELPARTAVLLTTLATAAVLLSNLTVRHRKVLVSLGLFVVTLVAGGCLIAHRTDAAEESIFAYDQLARRERWADLVRRADRSAPLTPWEQCCLNLALAKQGILCDRMFAYPQQGREALLPLYDRDYMTPMIAGEPYYHLGMVNTAQRFATEAMEAIPDYQKSARCYKRLAVTNLVNGRYEVARKYLRILEHTLYYRSWAERMSTFLDDDAAIDAHPWMGWMRRARYSEDFFANEQRVDYMLLMMVAHDSQNWMAWQYLFAHLLSTRQIDRLPHYAALMQQELPDRSLPVHVQEALLLYYLQTNGTLEGCPWRITPAVGERFVQMANAANRPRSEAETLLRTHFADTYGCYYLLTKEEPHE